MKKRKKKKFGQVDLGQICAINLEVDLDSYFPQLLIHLYASKTFYDIRGLGL